MGMPVSHSLGARLVLVNKKSSWLIKYQDAGANFELRYETSCRYICQSLRRRKHVGSGKGPYRNAEIAPQYHKDGRDNRVCGFGELDNT
jgi:hypothetical protein